MKPKGVGIKADGEDRLLDDRKRLTISGGEGKKIFKVLDSVSQRVHLGAGTNALLSSGLDGLRSVSQRGPILRQPLRV